MKAKTISFHDTGRFSGIVLDYLQDAPSLRPYYTYVPQETSPETLIAEKQKSYSGRAELVKVLQKQYADLHVERQVEKNISALGSDNGWCVVTAHQLNIFTGPLYVVYKALSAIRISRDWAEKYPAYQFVPVFWLGSEDHDIDEINHLHFFGKDWKWDFRQGGACGYYPTEPIQGLLDEIIAAFGNAPHAESLTAILRSAYAPGKTLAEATRALLHQLFGAYGLVVVDGDDRILKTMCIPLFEEELRDHSSATVMQKAMQDFPYDLQAQGREINLFYLDAGLRERILYDAETQQYVVANTTLRFSQNALFSLLQEAPEKFSPNVILRPVMQQHVLPAIAFTGGGGEIAYWLQLKAVFEHYGVAYPLLLLRNSFLLIDSNTAKRTEKLKLAITELFDQPHEITARYVKQHAETNLDLHSERKAIEELYQNLLKRVKALDPGLEPTILGEMQNGLNSLGKLEAKLLKAQKAKLETEVRQLQSTLTKLFPDDGLQERYDNFIPWYLKYGMSFFDEILLHSIQPVQGFTILSE